MRESLLYLQETKLGGTAELFGPMCIFHARDRMALFAVYALDVLRHSEAGQDRYQKNGNSSKLLQRMKEKGE